MYGRGATPGFLQGDQPRGANLRKKFGWVDQSLNRLPSPGRTWLWQPKPETELKKGEVTPKTCLHIKWQRAAPDLVGVGKLPSIYGFKVREGWAYQEFTDEILISYHRYEITPEITELDECELAGGERIAMWLENRVDMNSYHLGERPVRIYPPFTLTIREPGRNVWVKRTLGDRAANFLHLSPKGRVWGMWAWEYFWVRQVNYWHAQQKAYGGKLIAISRWQGIWINRELYNQLAADDWFTWKWVGDKRQNPWVGGYECPYPGWEDPTVSTVNNHAGRGDTVTSDWYGL